VQTVKYVKRQYKASCEQSSYPAVKRGNTNRGGNRIPSDESKRVKNYCEDDELNREVLGLKPSEHSFNLNDNEIILVKRVQIVI